LQTETDPETVTKARRRIKRMIETGTPQARVHPITDKLIEYKEVHHVKSLFFSRDSLNRIRLKKN